MNLSLVDLDGQIACSRDVVAGELRHEAFDTLVVMCPLARDTVATLAVTTFGAVDIAVEELFLEWVRPQNAR